jgi:hypothetical protein
MNKRTQKAALNNLKKLLIKEGTKMGIDTSELIILPAGHSQDYPLLSWEGGPFDWAVCLTGGSALWAGEFGHYYEDNPWFDKVEEIKDKFGIYFECQNSFQISAWD